MIGKPGAAANRIARNNAVMALYDTLGLGYRRTRQPDPRIAAQIEAAIGTSMTVANVGAGAGSYEPAATIVAIEPSSTMLAQRPPTAAAAVQAVAERLPLQDGSVDVAMAVLTVHHWTDLPAGITEMRRVARRRLVVLTWDQPTFRDFWLANYLPDAIAMEDSRAVPIETLTGLMGATEVTEVPVPHDCLDGFAAAFWRRPEAYLNPEVRAGISMFTQSDPQAVRRGIDALAGDLADGTWHRRHRDLLERDSYDAGYRLLTADLTAPQPGQAG